MILNRKKRSKEKNQPKPGSETNVGLWSLLGLLVGAFVLCLELFFQQAVMGGNPFLLQNYILPAVYGGITGLILATLIAKRLQMIINNYKREKGTRISFQKKVDHSAKVLSQLKSRLEYEMAENVKTAAALRKTKFEMNLLKDVSSGLGRVMIVDDDVNYLKNLRDAVAGADFEVVTAASGREGLMKLEQNVFDIVISDYKMPEMNGPDFLKNVKFDYPHINRVVMGDFIDQPTIIRILTEGLATNALVKPEQQNITEFKETIGRLLKLRGILKNQKIKDLMGSIEQLPRLPLVFNEFSDAVRRGANFQQLAEIINKDVSVATKILQITNTAFYGGEKTASVDQAIMMLGVNAIRDIVLTASMSDKSSSASAIDQFQKIMKHSMVVNKFMEPLSKLVYGKSIESNYKSVALTHDIGKIILLQNFPERYKTISSYHQRNPHLSFYDSELELGYDGCTHAELGAYLLDLWNFPSVSIEVALYHHTPSQSKDMQNNFLLRVASLANELVNFVAQSTLIESVNMNDFIKAIRREVL